MAAKKSKVEKTHNVEFAKGGNTPMFGHGEVTPSELQAGEQTPGQTAKDNEGGSGEKFASGGKGKMFGYTGSLPAKAGVTSAR